MDRAYQEYVSPTPVDEIKEINAWCGDQIAEHPQFQYWSMVLNLELLVVNLVGSIRSRDFQQYMKSIQDLIPWSFAMGTSTTHVAFQSIWGTWPRFLHFTPQYIHTSMKADLWHTGQRDHYLGWHWMKHLSNRMLLSREKVVLWV